MKIRKANLQAETFSVYIHENKKEEQTLIAIPFIKWSTVILYEEDNTSLTKRLEDEFQSALDSEEATHLSLKIVQWVREM
ncbi:YueH family protein [Sutcliffiella horikoshii]|uniref:YueH family protein n=1 Tax=Sutcliffiella horikoshii TaxID=79883 RepID=UPI002041E62E|nr:YueH family protein [Sutcliffiella horikoshii]MCM3618992.1 YueH family protein [Sutcliffiella horikoshii]